MPDAVRQEVRPPADRRHPGERPTSGRFARACCQHDFWMFRPEGLSATSNGRRCAPRAEKPRASGPTPLRRSARTDRSDPDEEPRARPRSPRSDGKEACALTMVPGRTPFSVPSLFPPRTRVPPSPPLSVSNGNSSRRTKRRIFVRDGAPGAPCGRAVTLPTRRRKGVRNPCHARVLPF